MYDGSKLREESTKTLLKMTGQNNDTKKVTTSLLKN